MIDCGLNKKKKIKLIGKRTIFIEKTVQIGSEVTIFQNNIIKGNTIIEAGVVLLPNNYIENSQIGLNSKIESSNIVDAIVGKNCSVGPFSRIRPKSKIGDNCKVGNFVEIKNSKLGNGTKASHLAYIGDADIGDNCNIGCGAIFVNYNGKEKNKSIVGNDCFIGSNCNIIAPVSIADKTYICAGTTLTKNTQRADFVIGRTRETVKAERALKYLKRGN